MREIVIKIKSLEQQDVKEVVLTGVHIGDYEDVVGTKQNKLEDLVEYVLKHTKIGRIRLSSLEPIELTDRLVELFKDIRLCPHFHMSIQSADTNVLANMKRKYTEQEVRNSLLRIKKHVSDAFVGMDVIAGFPTETEEQFENTIKVLSETPWTRLHVFPYSERQGTRAATLNQVSMMKRKERAQRLRELSLHRLQAEALKQVGKSKQILILNKPAKSYDGVSLDYWNVKLVSNANVDNYKNQEIKVNILSVQAEDGGTDVVLIGEFAE
jgi:threonylcarbamoyladenosine tRNA methylthiotransferase MtaB